MEQSLFVRILRNSSNQFFFLYDLVKTSIPPVHSRIVEHIAWKSWRKTIAQFGLLITLKNPFSIWVKSIERFKYCSSAYEKLSLSQRQDCLEFRKVVVSSGK